MEMRQTSAALAAKRHSNVSARAPLAPSRVGFACIALTSHRRVTTPYRVAASRRAGSVALPHVSRSRHLCSARITRGHHHHGICVTPAYWIFRGGRRRARYNIAKRLNAAPFLAHRAGLPAGKIAKRLRARFVARNEHRGHKTWCVLVRGHLRLTRRTGKAADEQRRWRGSQQTETARVATSLNGMARYFAHAAPRFPRCAAHYSAKRRKRDVGITRLGHSHLHIKKTSTHSRVIGWRTWFLFGCTCIFCCLVVCAHPQRLRALR